MRARSRGQSSRFSYELARTLSTVFLGLMRGMVGNTFRDSAFMTIGWHAGCNRFFNEEASGLLLAVLLPSDQIPVCPLMKLKDHPAVKRYLETVEAVSPEVRTLDAAWLRQLCLDCGADDVGLVEIERPALDDQRDDILGCLRQTKTLISFVCRMNREPIRAVARSVANLEFKHSVDDTNEIARRIVGRLEREGIRAVNPGVGYPMEMDKFPGKVWVVSHKPVAEAAGLGRMGLHRNVISSQVRQFHSVGTILIGAQATAPTISRSNT